MGKGKKVLSSAGVVLADAAEQSPLAVRHSSALTPRKMLASAFTPNGHLRRKLSARKLSSSKHSDIDGDKDETTISGDCHYLQKAAEKNGGAQTRSHRVLKRHKTAADAEQGVIAAAKTSPVLVERPFKSLGAAANRPDRPRLKIAAPASPSIQHVQQEHHSSRQNTTLSTTRSDQQPVLPSLTPSRTRSHGNKKNKTPKSTSARTRTKRIFSSFASGSEKVAVRTLRPLANRNANDDNLARALDRQYDAEIYNRPAIIETTQSNYGTQKQVALRDLLPRIVSSLSHVVASRSFELRSSDVEQLLSVKVTGFDSKSGVGTGLQNASLAPTPALGQLLSRLRSHFAGPVIPKPDMKKLCPKHSPECVNVVQVCRDLPASRRAALILFSSLAEHIIEDDMNDVSAELLVQVAAESLCGHDTRPSCVERLLINLFTNPRGIFGETMVPYDMTAADCTLSPARNLGSGSPVRNSPCTAAAQAAATMAMTFESFVNQSPAGQRKFSWRDGHNGDGSTVNRLHKQTIALGTVSARALLQELDRFHPAAMHAHDI